MQQRWQRVGLTVSLLSACVIGRRFKRVISHMYLQPRLLLLLLLSATWCLRAAISIDGSGPSHAILLRKRGQLVEYSRGDLQFELFLPAHWQPATASHGSHPVLVFLHGRGESGAFDVTNAQSLPLQLLTNASFAAAFPFIAVVPQCPSECAAANGWLPQTLQAVTSLLREWVLVSGAGAESRNSNTHLGGDRSRVYLAGQSMGGHGAWSYAAQQPRLFAAVVVVCGYAQGGREATAFAERLSKGRMAVAVYHSADDSVIPVAASDQMVGALKASGYGDAGGGGGGNGGGNGGGDGGGGNGGRPLRFVRYMHAPGPPMPEYAHLIGHGSYELAFRDAGLYTWLQRQTCERCSNKPPAAWHPISSSESDGGELRA